MRRRRRHLEVSTFPFLAVLLCTMGSLILLLLVLDRRAKIVAQLKAKNDYAAVQAAMDRRELERQSRQTEEQRIADERQAEWERRRQQLHAMLAQEEQDLLGQIEQTRDKVAVANNKLQTEQGLVEQQKGQLFIAKTRLIGLQETAAARQDAAVKAAELTEAARRELDRQAGALQQLEQTLLSLKALREQQKNTYSLVPYIGRRGDNRRPVYVECAGSAVTFHPDRVALEGLQLTGERIRAEVANRVSRQREQSPALSGEDPPRPYLLMLIRPDGIRAYYHTQEALAGMKLDFGYEFIESDWVLDFSNEGNDIAAQQWITAAKLAASSPKAPPSPERPVSLGGGKGLIVGPGGNGGLGTAASQGVLAPGIGNASGGAWQPGGSGSYGGGVPGMPNGLPPLSPGTGVKGMLAGPQDSKVVANGRHPNVAAGTGFPGVAPSQPGTVGKDAKELANAAESGSGSRPVPPSTSASGMPNGLPPMPQDNRPQDNRPQGIPAGSNDSKGGANGGNQVGAGQPGSPGIPPSPPGTGSKDAKDFANTGENGSNTGVGLGQTMTDSAKGAPSPAPLGRILGNRDWPIYIECNADGVILKQGNQTFPLESLSAPTRGEHPLMQTVRELIDRRQATVRAGETPYRPLLRFQVRPDGLRTYYLAYPLLDALRLPMARDNLQKP